VILTIIALCLVVPQHGAYGAGIVIAVALTLVRGFYLAVVMCRLNALSVRYYANAIYTRPLLAGIPVLALAAVMRHTVLAGTNWFELITAAAILTLVYFGIAAAVVLDPLVRSEILGRLRRRHGRTARTVAAAD